MLLTLSNISALRTTIVPHLVTQFETDFSVTLTSESSTITELLISIESRLFASYTRPLTDALVSTVSAGISSPTWVPSTSRPTEVRPYVYAVLLQLVHVHSEVSTTASALLPRILSHLLEQLSRALMDAFRKKGKFQLPALMQATLDVEFIAQNLSQYATERSSVMQNEIYQDLDRATDEASRSRLKQELPKMRGVLKELRERTRGEFACFRRAKK